MARLLLPPSSCLHQARSQDRRAVHSSLILCFCGLIVISAIVYSQPKDTHQGKNANTQIHLAVTFLKVPLIRINCLESNERFVGLTWHDALATRLINSCGRAHDYGRGCCGEAETTSKDTISPGYESLLLQGSSLLGYN